MNNTIIREEVLIPAVLEVSGATLTSYLSAMGMVLVQYDCILTLKEEVCLISFTRPASHLSNALLEIRLVWPGPLSFSKVLYYLNRYIPIVSLLFCNYRR